MSCPTGHPFLVGGCTKLSGVKNAGKTLVFGEWSFRSLEHGLFGKPVPTPHRVRGRRFPDHALLPHPVVAPVAFPAGQPAFAELQVEPVLDVKESAAADIAEREKDFVAQAAADVVKRHAERGCGLLRVHAEKQRRVVRQRRGEGWRVGPADWRQTLCARSCREGDQQQGCRGKDSHDAAFCVCLASSPSRNGSTASIKACGWSILTAWPAAGVTNVCGPGNFFGK